MAQTIKDRYDLSLEDKLKIKETSLTSTDSNTHAIKFPAKDGTIALTSDLSPFVKGPSSATDNAIARFDGTSGKLIQNSNGVFIDDSGNITISHNTSNDMAFTSANPKITFAENGSQPVSMIYTDYDSYRGPAGLKIIGNQSNVWLEAPQFIKTNGTGVQVLMADGTTTSIDDKDKPSSSSRVYDVAKHSDGKLYVHVPWEKGTSKWFEVNSYKADGTEASGVYSVLSGSTGAGNPNNHSLFINVKNVGTPFQIQIPDASDDYIYKWTSAGKWRKIKAGYADSAGNADTVDGYHVEYDNGYTSNNPTYICGFDTGNKKIKCAKNGYVDGYIKAGSGFKKEGSSNDYVLLGDTDHKALSDFIIENGANNIKAENTCNKNMCGFGYSSYDFPTNGSFISFGGFGSHAYSTQIQGKYNGNGDALFYRTINGDNGTRNPWHRLANADDFDKYVLRAGDTMTGTLAIHRGNQTGLKVGTCYLTNCDGGGEVILQGGHLRFGTSAWDYDQWAGLAYDNAQKTIHLGLASGYFTHNSGKSEGTIHFDGINCLDINSNNIGDSSFSAAQIKFGASSSDLPSSTRYRPLWSVNHTINGKGYGSTCIGGVYRTNEVDKCGYYLGMSWDGNNSEKYFYFSRQGQLGIGVDKPSYPLQVAGDIYANGWLRTSGQVGWYNQTYNGGWYMSDATWVRSYADKNVYTGNGIIRSDNQLQVGGNGSSFWASNSGAGVGANKHYYMNYNGNNYPVLYNHGNSNVSVNACGGGLYVGYFNTSSIWIGSNENTPTHINKGHIFLEGANASNSTANTSQIVFGTPTNNHVVVSSNNNNLIINKTVTDTTNQIQLRLDDLSNFPTGMETSRLRVINDSSDNSDDAVFYIQNRSTSDWAQKIDITNANYGLRVTGPSDASQAVNIDGIVNINAHRGNYGEGIRFNASSGQWVTIRMGGSTGTDGTGEDIWSIHRTSGNNFAISRNSSDGVNGLFMGKNGYMGLGTASPGYRLHVVGTTYSSVKVSAPRFDNGSSSFYIGNGNNGWCNFDVDTKFNYSVYHYKNTYTQDILPHNNGSGYIGLQSKQYYQCNVKYGYFEDVLPIQRAKSGRIGTSSTPFWYGYFNVCYAQSDARLKENIVDSTLNYYDIIEKMKLREFTWKSQRENPQLNFGLIAQELDEIIPDRLKGFFVDKGDDENQTLSINDARVGFLALGALQQQLEINKELKEKNNKLEERLAKLEEILGVA